MEQDMAIPSDMRSPIFIGGQPRSGTTLVRVLLNRHPHIACGPDSKFAQHPSFVRWHDRLADEWSERVARYGFGPDVVDRSFAALVDNIFTRYQLAEGKRRWAEKTPTNILRIDYLFRLFPHAQFVHVIRDPRDTYCSIRERVRKGKYNWSKYTAESSAQEWRRGIQAGKHWREAKNRYMELRYEDLVQEPEVVMRRVLAFLTEPWDPRVLDPEVGNDEIRRANTRPQRGRIFGSSVGRWQTELDTCDVSTIETVAAELMADVGYDLHMR